MSIWIQFIACAGVILIAGAKLSKYGDIIAEKTGLGRTWIGFALIASVTSLPELITGMGSAAIFGLPEIAAGDVLGSCMFNIFILFLLDLISGSLPISAQAHQGQVLTGSFGALLLGLAIIGIVAGEKAPSIGWVGIYSFAFIAVYFLAMRIIFLYEKKRVAEFVKEMAEEARYQNISKAKAFRMFAINALFIVGAAIYLPHLGEHIAEMTGIGQSFVGNILVATSTSMPELVVSAASMRIGAVDMIFGNLLGSNLFNMAILGIDDLLYAKGPILSHVSISQSVAAGAAIMMTSIAIIGLTYRSGRKVFLFGWDSAGIGAVYLLAIYILSLLR